ncbi:MAG TPA: glycosyltransferase family 4 protein [Bryobacteraceae bacterium]|nr:glycosyltransferase family 4 protein [Bryobacteraceae bacterium]
MRILHLDAGREMRGGQWQVLRLIEGLAAEGIESTLLARRASPLWEAAAKAGYRVAPLGFAQAAIQARRHDLVHAHDAHSHTLGAIVRGTPLVVSRRVAFPIHSPWKYGRAARYIAVSHFVESVLAGGGVLKEKISVVYDGVPVLPLTAPAAPPRILTPANAADAAKGADLATEAARLAGIELEASADLERDLPGASAFVYITHSEGLGSAVLLAMSAGVPVVASNTGGLPEIILDHETGLLTANAPAAISAALTELLTQPDLARRLGATARARVLDRFTTAHMVRSTIAVYRQVLS